MTHANAPLTPAGRLRLVQRCEHRPIAHVAAEAGVARPTFTKWLRRYDTLELTREGHQIAPVTVGRWLRRLGISRRRDIDPTGATNRSARRIVARYPGHMVHLDVKKVGRIPDGGGWRTHGRGSDQAKAVDRAKAKGARTGYV